MYKLYLLVFDPYKTDADALHRVIDKIPGLLYWWHYIGSGYILKSTSNAAAMEDYINRNWSGNFFLTEINANNSGGWLPSEAWNWINKNK